MTEYLYYRANRVGAKEEIEKMANKEHLEVLRQGIEIWNKLETSRTQYLLVLV